MRELKLDPAKVNPLGGAIALGHPLGATGAIRTATLVHGLRRTGGKHGLVTMHRHRHGRGWPVRGAVGRRVSSEALLVQAPVPEWRARLMRVGFNLHPAFRATGGRVLHVSPDFHHIRIKLPLLRRTRNIVGSMYGGSLFAVTDGAHPTMLMSAPARITSWGQGGVHPLPQARLHLPCTWISACLPGNRGNPRDPGARA